MGEQTRTGISHRDAPLGLYRVLAATPEALRKARKEKVKRKISGAKTPTENELLGIEKMELIQVSDGATTRSKSEANEEGSGPFSDPDSSRPFLHARKKPQRTLPKPLPLAPLPPIGS